MARAFAALIAALTIAAVAVGGGIAAAPRFTMNDGQPGVSSNWSGYALEDATSAGLQFTSVTGTWTQPKTKCDGTASSAAFWVGIGGESTASTGLEQTGTGVDCNGSGKARYYAWYEILPAAAIELPLKVRPGDVITTSVNINGNAILFQIKNRTRKTSFTKTVVDADVPDLTSAEWIAEAPSSCDGLNRCRVVPLANFGTVTFTRAATIASAHPGTITDTTWSNVAIKLVPDGSGQFSRFNMSTAGALPGALSSDGRSFPVSWVSNATP